MDDIALPGGRSASVMNGHARSSTLAEMPAVVKAAFGRPERKAGASPYMRFRKDRYYLLRYYFANIAVLGAAAAMAEVLFGTLGELPYLPLWLVGLVLFVLPSFSLIFLSGLYYLVLAFLVWPESLTPASLALVPAGILAGTVSAALMHNAAHGNFRRGWQNRFWGEVCGLFQLSGFAGWCISHFIHHSAPDNPEKDAHAPGDMSFRTYVNAMGQLMKANLTARYFEMHGDSVHSRATWSLVGALLPLVRYLRIAFILVLLGPTLFVVLYVPFKIANTLIYGDFNYRTHRPTANGGYEVLNLNHTIWYKVLNAISFGSYFHKNHHRKPNVFNPRHADDDGKPFVTYQR